jgi:hypothetical protein
MKSHFYAQVPRPRPSMSFRVRMLMIIAVVAFGALHLMGGIVLSHASHDQPVQDSSAAMRGD